MTTFHFIFLSLIIGLLYLAVADRLRTFGARFRLQAAERGVELLKNPAVPIHLKHTIEGLLANVPRTRVAWLFAACAIPAALSLFAGKDPKKSVYAGTPFFEKWDEFTSVVILASLCNSPAAMFICAFEMAGMSFLVSAQAIVDIMAEQIGRQADNKHLGGGAVHTP